MLPFAVALIALLAASFAGATQHPWAFLLRAVVALVCIALWPRRISWSRSEVAVVLAALTVVALGTLTSPHMGIALQSLVSATMVVVVYATFRGSSSHLDDTLLLVALVVALPHAGWALVERALGAKRAAAGFFNPNDLAALLAPVAVLVMGRLRGPGRIVLASFLTAGVWATESRSGAVALALGGFITLVTETRHWPLWRRAVALGGLMLVCAAIGYGARGRWSGASDAYAYDRLAIWRASGRVAEAHPLGVGLGGYEDALRLEGVPLEGPVRYPKTAQHAHSELVQAWVELGWTGALVVVLSFLWMLRACTTRRRSRELGVLAAFAVPAAVSASLHVPPVALLMAAWAGGVLRREPDGDDVRLGMSRGAITGLLVVTLSVTLPGVVSYLYSRQAAAAREARDLETAARAAERARIIAPWSLGAAMLDESIKHLRGATPLDTVERLLALAEAFPESPEPLERASALLEAQSPDNPRAWDFLAKLRHGWVERDPHNALAWAATGEALMRGSSPESADAAFHRAVSEEPRCGRAHAGWAMALARRGAHDEARQHAEVALASAARAEKSDASARRILELDASHIAAMRRLVDGEP